MINVLTDFAGVLVFKFVYIFVEAFSSVGKANAVA